MCRVIGFSVTNDNQHTLYPVHNHLKYVLTVCAVPSHQPYLVQLNWTWVCFPHLVRFVGAGVNAAGVSRVRTRSGPDKWTETWLKRWSQHASKRTLVWFVCSENVFRPWSALTAQSSAVQKYRPGVCCMCAHVHLLFASSEVLNCMQSSLRCTSTSLCARARAFLD